MPDRLRARFGPRNFGTGQTRYFLDGTRRAMKMIEESDIAVKTRDVVRPLHEDVDSGNSQRIVVWTVAAGVIPDG